MRTSALPADSADRASAEAPLWLAPRTSAYFDVVAHEGVEQQGMYGSARLPAHARYIMPTTAPAVIVTTDSRSSAP